MAITIEGYSVVALTDRIYELLDRHAIQIPNSTAVGDDDLWRCSFMAESDAIAFIQSLEKLDLNASRGPNPDVVLVNEFDRSVSPYCEWLVMGQWEKAVIAWKTGTRPERVVAREGWDPKRGSGLSFADSSSGNLEFLQLDGNIEVYMNKDTGQELYVGRTTPSADALFKTAAGVISKHFVDPGQKTVTGKAAEDVAQALEMLDRVLAAAPDSWNVLWFHGKGQMALGHLQIAYRSFRRAFELQRDEQVVPRELAGVCLQLGKFEEAVATAEAAVALVPDNPALLGNLAIAYLLAKRLPQAQRAIAAAIKLDGNDSINRYLAGAIGEVANGKRAQPGSLAALMRTPHTTKKRFWEFWKR